MVNLTPYTANVWNLNVQISDSAEIRTKGSLDFRHLGFLGNTKHLDFSMFGFQTVSEIQTFEHVSLASKWLLGFQTHIFRSEIQNFVPFGFFRVWISDRKKCPKSEHFGSDFRHCLKSKLSGNWTKLNCLKSKLFGFQTVGT